MIIATTATRTAIITNDAASNGTSQPYSPATAAANTTTTVQQELSELLFSNQLHDSTHQASMKKSRVKFQAALVDDKSNKEKQAGRNIFSEEQRRKTTTLYEEPTGAPPIILLEKIESKEEQKAAPAALRSLMMEKKKKNGNGTNAATAIEDTAAAAKEQHSYTVVVDPNLAGTVQELYPRFCCRIVHNSSRTSMHDFPV